MRGTFLASFFLLVSLAFGWNAHPHRVIGRIAEKNLNPIAQRNVNYLTTLFGREYSENSGIVFGAPWLDTLRGNSAAGKYLLAHFFTQNWHWTDDKLFNDTTGGKCPSGDMPENSIWASKHFVDIIKSPHQSDVNKAYALLALTHTITDMHQVAHNIARCTDKDTPNQADGGDQGVNNIKLKPAAECPVNGPASSLHAFWDATAYRYNGLPSSASLEEHMLQIEKDADTILALQPADTLALFNPHDIANFPKWHDELVLMAEFGGPDGKSAVYMNPDDRVVFFPDVPVCLSQAYADQTANYAEMYLALAGYRYANLLNHILSIPLDL